MIYFDMYKKSTMWEFSSSHDHFHLKCSLCSKVDWLSRMNLFDFIQYSKFCIIGYVNCFFSVFHLLPHYFHEKKWISIFHMTVHYQCDNTFPNLLGFFTPLPSGWTYFSKCQYSFKLVITFERKTFQKILSLPISDMTFTFDKCITFPIVYSAFWYYFSLFELLYNPPHDLDCEVWGNFEKLY